MHQRLESLLRLDQIAHIESSSTTIVTLVEYFLSDRLLSQLTITGIGTQLLARLSAIPACKPLDPLVEEDLRSEALIVGFRVIQPFLILDALAVGFGRVFAISFPP